MMSMDVMHFKNDGFNISMDADADQQDNRLQRELKQLIAEQFEDFDLGDENENVMDNRSCFSDELPAASDYDGIDPDTEEVASIQEAGKLSLLEAAIKKFGEDDTQDSEETTTDRLATQECFDSNSLVHKTTSSREHCFPRPNACNSNSNDDVNDTIDAELWIKTPTAASDRPGYAEATKMPAVQMVEDSEQPCFTDKTINWELSLPGEVGNELFIALHNDRDTLISPLGEGSAYQPECCASSPVREEAVRNTSPTLTATVQRQLSGMSGETVSWPRTALTGLKFTDPAYPIPASIGTMHTTTQWAVNESTTSVSEGYAKTLTDTDDLRSAFPTALPMNLHERRELLYAARGRQVEDLLAEVNRLQEEIAKEKRLSNHRATLAEGERESLRSKLCASENTIQLLQKELQDNQERLSKLNQRLTESEAANNKLNNDLINLRTTNESLSAQLVELTTGDAMRRVEEREDKLTEALERRYSAVAEEVKSELTAANKRLAEREKEIAGLQRQIEVYKSDLKKAQDEYNDSIHRANQQLEESQQHCQKLASSVLCTEVTNLRQMVSELKTSKKITDDVNTILQSELRGLREQVSLYEKMLKLDDVPVEDRFQGDFTNSLLYSETSKECDPKNCFSNDTVLHRSETQHPSNVPSASTVEKLPEDHHGLEEDTKLDVDVQLDANRRRAHFARSENSTNTETQPGVDTGHEAFHSLSRQGILTSTPAPHFRMGRLPVEVERCLADCKAKREEITKLHETLFTTRCQLHHATEAAQKAEKNASMLQDRVLQLEREIASSHEMNGTPGPRESALSGQLDRLKADYAKLEDELQTTRTRLQTALGSEARALENEKTASERLAASTAERDAAVNRARAVCESHYTAMRRRLEIDWANERESMERVAEERLSKIRQELIECETNLNRMTKLYQDSQRVTQEAVDGALREAMQERENERIRFWREELPKQLESARATWEQEWSDLRDMAIRQAVEECERRIAAERESSSADHEQPKSRDVAHIGTITEQILLLDCALQTDTQLLVSLCGSTNETESGFRESSPNPTASLAVQLRLRVLHKFMSTYDLNCLRTQLLETDRLNLQSLDRMFHLFVRRRCKFYSKQSWSLMALALQKLSDDFKLNTILDTNCERFPDLLTEKATHPIFNVDLSLLSNEKSGPNCSRSHSPASIVSESSEGLSDTVETCSGVNQKVTKLQSDGTGRSVRENVLLHMRQIVQSLHDTRKSLDFALAKQASKQVVPGSNLTSSELYNSTLRQIKQDVLNYAETCQTRAAETLQAEFARVHRHACRQFTAHLHRALYRASTQSFSTEARFVLPRRSTIRPVSMRSVQNNQYVNETTTLRPSSVGSRPHPNVESIDNQLHSPISRTSLDFQSLLNMIDQVCESTEKKFSMDVSTDDPVVEPPDSVEQMQPHEFSSFGDPPSSPGSRCLRSKESASVSLNLNQLPSPVVYEGLKNIPKYECTTAPAAAPAVSSVRKLPARTRASLAWIQIQPPQSSPATPVYQWRKFDDEHPKQVSSPPDSRLTYSSLQPPECSKPATPTEHPLIITPVRVSCTCQCRPVPAPRTVKSVIRPDSEPPMHDATTKQKLLTDNTATTMIASPGRVPTTTTATLPTVQLTTEPKKHRVHVDLYNLFEQLSGTPGYK